MGVRKNMEEGVSRFARKGVLAVCLAIMPVVAVGSVGVVAVSAPVYAAMSLDAAKSQGLVGERPDGLLGVVGGAASGEVQALVKDVNARRMEIFKKVAKDKGQSVETVQKISGQEFIDRTPAGQYVMNAQGAWQKK